MGRYEPFHPSARKFQALAVQLLFEAVTTQYFNHVDHCHSYLTLFLQTSFKNASVNTPQAAVYERLVYINVYGLQFCLEHYKLWPRFRLETSPTYKRKCKQISSNSFNLQWFVVIEWLWFVNDLHVNLKWRLVLPFCFLRWYYNHGSIGGTG